MNQLITQNTLITAGISAILWGLTVYYIRFGLNPKVNLEEKKVDVMYGSLAVFIARILDAIIKARFFA